MIEITGWNETFENADTRKRQRLKSFHNPSGVDSGGYISLASQGKAGMQALGVFLALCQLSATLKSEHRGRLLRSNGKPMTLELLAATLRLDPCHLSASLELLSSESVGWVSYLEDLEPSANHLPPACHSHPDFVQGEGEGEGEGEDSSLTATSQTRSDAAGSGKAQNQDYRDLIQWSPAGFTGISEEIKDRWKIAYPACDLTSQIARASEWLLANPQKKKRKPGRFLVNWLARAQERGGDANANQSKGNAKGRSSRYPGHSRNDGTANADRAGQYAGIG